MHTKNSLEIIKYVIKKKINLPDKFNIDDDMVTDKLEIALNVSDFYANIGKKLSNDIPTNSGGPLSYYKVSRSRFNFLISVDESEIINICKNTIQYNTIQSNLFQLSYMSMIIIIHGMFKMKSRKGYVRS